MSFENATSANRMYPHYDRASRGMISAMAFAVAISLSSLLGIVAPTPAEAQTAPYLDANGWTIFTPSSDTQVIYVSSSTGNETS